MIRATSSLTKKQKNDIWALLKMCDSEFVPPLSKREGTTQKNLLNEIKDSEPTEYFDALIKQSFILYTKCFKVIGFLSFIPDHKLKAGEALDINCDYISTIIVNPKYRNKGITTAMYQKLFRERSAEKYATRTWSQNHAHISILEKLGFKLILTLKDDRGEGVDTVYYAKGENNA